MPRIRRRALVGSLLALAVAAAFASSAGAEDPAVRITEAPKAPRTGRGLDAGQTGRVIIGYRSSARVTALGSVDAEGGAVERASSGGGFVVVDPPAGVDPTTFAEKMASEPGVAYADPENYVYAAWATNDYLLPYQTNMPLIGGPPSGHGNQTVPVAIIDTGGGPHEDLEAWAGANFVEPGGTNYDDNGHGTHVAGIVGAITNNGLGIAAVSDRAQMRYIKALDSRGVGTDADLADAIRYSAGMRVINLSVVSFDYDPAIAAAVRYAQSQGSLVVAASGNDGANTVSFPAMLPGVVAVGSTPDGVVKSDFSNYGPELDVMAPGEDILSTIMNPSFPEEDYWYARVSGTSAATPHVTGLAATLAAYFPGYSANQLAARIRASATDMTSAGEDLETGYGMISIPQSVAIHAAPSPDDVLPGVPLTSNSAVGAQSPSDPHDIYEVFALAGQSISATVTTDPGVDVGLRLLPREATSLDATEMASSTDTDAASVVATAPLSGCYFLVVDSGASPAPYTLTYSASGGDEPDDEIPGVPAPASPIADTLDRAGDQADAYAITLNGHWGLEAVLEAEPGTDFDLALFSSGADSLSDKPVVFSGSSGSSERISFSVPTTGGGTYYLVPLAYSGAGDYTLTWRVINGTQTAASSPRTCAWGSTITITGAVGYGRGGLPVVVEHLPQGATTWKVLGTTQTNEWNNFTFSAKPTRRTQYRASFPGTSDYAASSSGAFTVTPKAYLSRLVAPSRIGKGRAFTVYGYLKPRHTAGAKSVTLYAYRLERVGSEYYWIRRKTFYTVNANYSSYTKYARRISLPYAGKWMVIGTLPSDSIHAYSETAAKYITVY